jgi:hypothetical protein
MSNKIGKRGESIFSTIISRYIEPGGQFLEPWFLDSKFPTVDFHVDLLQYELKRGFFFASVKTTSLGYYSDKSKLNIDIDKKEIIALKKFTVPVYLFGIDVKKEEGFFINANTLNENENLNGITTKYPVNNDFLLLLWKEVSEYWDDNNEISNFKTYFT